MSPRRFHRSRHRRRSLRRIRPRPPEPAESEASGFHPRVNRRLAPVLAEIGVPEATPFRPDPFQVEAVEKLATGDVVVSAPTGSGKTWIAEQAIRACLERGHRAWYASPLKALSNSKYAEFMEIFGEDRVGILTGERKEKPGADLIVGTTEILRNQLYDAMYRGQDLDAGLVVLDEAHFLGDPDRGVVWEEVIIYLPVRVRLLLLSATVQNADQIARWLEFVRGERCHTVVAHQRPVPLYPIFLFPDGELAPLLRQGRLFPKVRHFLEHHQMHRPRSAREATPPFARILRAAEAADLLPAIFFLKSRADCDAALSQVAAAGLEVSEDKRQALAQEVEEFLERYPFLASHPHLSLLKSLHVAAHHAGHLPHWKMLVERLMQRGLLKAIFSTSTVAAGVNFPARTVVITQSDRFNGREFVDLSATDLLQMTGRAGRRGMDKIGFCLVVPGPFNDVPLVAALLGAEPEPIQSQLHINFSMVLNLLLSHQPEEIKQLLGNSLATFQRLERSRGRRGGEGLAKLMRPLSRALADTPCQGPEEAVVRWRRWRQLMSLRRHLQEEMASLEERGELWGALTRGRVFLDLFGTTAAVLRREERPEEPGVLAVSLEPERRLRRGRPRIDFVPLSEVTGVFQEVIDLPQAGGGRALARAVLEQRPQRPRPLPPEELTALVRQEAERLQQRLVSLDHELMELACADCPQAERCHGEDTELARLLAEAERILVELREESHVFWFDFVRHLEFLRSEGFVDQKGRLTDDGVWASKLRLDQPVLIAEAIRMGALPQDDPVLLAALMALFVDEREREGSDPFLVRRLYQALQTLRHALDPLLGRLRQWGFEVPPLPPAAAAAVYAWGLGGEFNHVAGIYGGAEGDLAQLIYRTADNLRQVISLQQTHPRLADTAREAVDLLLRPPVVVPV